LNSVELALARIADRVKKGGHNIPKDVVIRRYERSLHNLLNMFMPICDKWYIEDNSSEIYSEIAKGRMSNSTRIYDNEKWSIINDYKN
ncbi:MAG TPA: hypothetical protein PKD94_05610, partial [Ignavibacteria bacterium]|nr:hypothetical protein [Ignavibacteria bacterium]